LVLYRLERLFGCPIVASDGDYGYPHYWSGPLLWKEVTGYHLQMTHDPMGHIAGFLLDTANWAIRYVVVDTRNWLPGKHLVIPPQWIKSVDWIERVVNAGVTRDIVEAAPEYHPDLGFSPAYAAELYRHYRRPAAGRPAR
jgi:hypothetical protein